MSSSNREEASGAITAASLTAEGPAPLGVPLPAGFLEELRVGWRMLLIGVLALPMCIMPGASIGVFIQPLSDSFGWSLLSISAVAGFTGCGTIIGAPVIGRLIDRWGFRKVVLIFMPALSAVIAATSLIGPGVWSLYAMMFLWGFVGAGWVASFVRSIDGWFVRGQAAAISIMFTAGGVGCALAPYLTQWVISKHGWRLGFVSLAAAVLAVWPLSFAWLQEKSTTGAGHTRKEALHSALFWHLSAAWLLSGLTAGGFFFLVPFLLQEGLSQSEAALSLSVLYAASGVIHLPLAAINNRISPIYVSAGALTLKAAAFFLLAVFGSRYVYLASVLAGFGISGLSNSLFNCLPRYFGLRAFGEISGFISSICSAAAMLGPPLFGFVLERSATYTSPYLMIAILSLVAAACMFAAGHSSSRLTHPRLGFPEQRHP